MAVSRQRGHFFAMWQDLTRVLPVGNDHASQSGRGELFNALDVQGSGVCFQANVIRGLARRLPFIADISDMKTVLHRAFRSTVDCVPSIAAASVCQIDRNQFRFLLLYLWHYFKLWEQFSNTDAAKGRRVTLRDFVLAVPLLKHWGCPVGAWEEDPEAVFADLHRGAPQGQNGVFFDDLADLCLRLCLQHWCSSDVSEERSQAIRALRRTHPTMVPEETEAPSPPAKSGALAARASLLRPQLPLSAVRQETLRPAMQSCGGPSGGTVLRPAPDDRWQSSYMNSYLAPSNLPPPKTPCKESVFPFAPDTRQPYAWQKPERILVEPFDQQPIARSRSVGCLGSPLPTNRAALRLKVDRQLDMYSTAQMRNLLAVAGGMTVNGK